MNQIVIPPEFTPKNEHEEVQGKTVIMRFKGVSNEESRKMEESLGVSRAHQDYVAQLADASDDSTMVRIATGAGLVTQSIVLQTLNHLGKMLPESPTEEGACLIAQKIGYLSGQMAKLNDSQIKGRTGVMNAKANSVNAMAKAKRSFEPRSIVKADIVPEPEKKV